MGTSRFALAAAIIAASVGVFVAPEVAIAAGTDPTISVTVGGGAATNLTAASTVAVTTRTPVPAGDGTQTLSTTWTPGSATVAVNSIVSPEGFTREYRLADGTWTNTLPNPTSVISGVRASATYGSDGYNDQTDTQISKIAATGELGVGAAEFQGSSGGDGWDVFFNHPTYDKVLNVWHHNSSEINLDCHFKDTGASCWSGIAGGASGGTVFVASGYNASNKSGGGSYGGKVYLFTRKTTAPFTNGFYCVDVSGVSPASCNTPFYGQNAGSDSDYSTVSEAVQIGSKIYGFDMNTDTLLCLDAGANPVAACPGSPYSIGVTGGTTFNTYLEASGTKVFVSGDGKLGCLDSTTDASCAGFPVNATSTGMPIAADGSGGICFLDTNDRDAGAGDGNCFSSLGVQSARPAALSTLLQANPIDGLHASYGSVATSGFKLYWGANVVGNHPTFKKRAYCFDFSTGLACAGFANNLVLSGNLYATVVEPSNPNCIWGNGDNGKITSFNATTGVGGCALPIPEVVYPAAQAAPRLGCVSPAGAVSAWSNVKITIPVGVTIADLEFRVKNSAGTLVNGWSAIDLGSDAKVSVVGRVATINLSTLTVGQTGVTPEFRVVTYQGVTDVQAEQIDAVFTFSSMPPELCLNLTPVAACPTGVGQAQAATVPPTNLNVEGKSTRVVGATTTNLTASGVTSMAPKAGCLGTVKGIVLDEDNDPVEKAVVALYDGNTKLAEGETAANGEAVFTNVYPFAAAALSLRFGAGGGFIPIDENPAALAQLTAGNTVSVTRTFRPLIYIPPPTSPATTTPVTTAPPSTQPPVPVTATPGSLPQLPPGQSQAIENGVPVPVEVKELSRGSWQMTGQNFQWQMNIPPADTPGSSQGEVLLVRNRDVEVSGFGFLSETLVDVWLFPGASPQRQDVEPGTIQAMAVQPIYLGKLKVNADGTFAGPLNIPNGVSVGQYTIQANGTSFDGVPRTLNLGVRVIDTKPRLPITGGDSTDLATVAWLMMLFGLVTVLIGRRRRSIN